MNSLNYKALVPAEEIKDSPLSADEICKILRECRKSGVRQFTLGVLSVEFMATEAKVEKDPTELGPAPLRYPAKVIELGNEIAANALLQGEIESKEQMLDRLMLENPLEYERLVAEGELTDGSTSSADE